MLAKLHSRLGDFWWYSIMLFCACRLADCLNALIGLWLVPKYIGTEELGAVLPLLSFAAFISMPANVFAMAFMKEIISLATYGEYGKMKSLMRGVFIGTGALLLIAIIVSHFIFPLFLQRIRIEKGSLGILILTSAFCSAVAPIYSNACIKEIQRGGFHKRRKRTISFSNYDHRNTVQGTFGIFRRTNRTTGLDDYFIDILSAQGIISAGRTILEQNRFPPLLNFLYLSHAL